LLPNRKDWCDSAWPIARGSALGFLLGIVPGPGPVIASFVSYAVEKRVSRYPEKFGTGVIAAQFNLLPGESKSGNVAYFSMEIGIDSSMPTYSGGLGILAGDTLRAAADLGLPVVGVTLLHRKGYFRQRLDAAGNQFELPATWNFEEVLEPMVPRVAVFIEERVVQVRAWRCLVRGVFGHTVPVYFLDTALEQNSEWDRSLTDALSEGDAHHRLCQEVVLGMGGVAMLQALSYKNVSTYHMNEGHAAFLTLGLLEREAARGDLNLVTDADREAVRQRCVFTTHTPVPAGHDQFGAELVRQVARCGTNRRPGSLAVHAQGTSGMKAALNGHIEGVTGWSIDGGSEGTVDPAAEAASLYDKLEHEVLPLYYGKSSAYTEVRRSAIALNGSFFNTQRMVLQYVRNAYLGVEP
jgi:glucan phosphorylase